MNFCIDSTVGAIGRAGRQATMIRVYGIVDDRTFIFRYNTGPKCQAWISNRGGGRLGTGKDLRREPRQHEPVFIRETLRDLLYEVFGLEPDVFDAYITLRAMTGKLNRRVGI